MVVAELGVEQSSHQLLAHRLQALSNSPLSQLLRAHRQQANLQFDCHQLAEAIERSPHGPHSSVLDIYRAGRLPGVRSGYIWLSEIQNEFSERDNSAVPSATLSLLSQYAFRFEFYDF